MSDASDGDGRARWKIALLGLAVLVVVVGFFLYRAVEGGLPSCEPAFKSCLQRCEETGGDAAAVKACRRACEADRNRCHLDINMPRSLYGDSPTKK